MSFCIVVILFENIVMALSAAASCSSRLDIVGGGYDGGYNVCVWKVKVSENSGEEDQRWLKARIRVEKDVSKGQET